MLSRGKKKYKHIQSIPVFTRYWQHDNPKPQPELA
jgi:hypothetical protein